MLTPADVARFLSHDTKEVRDHALRSLALAGGRGEVQADVPLKVLSQLGMNAFSEPALIAQLRPSSETAAKAFETASGAGLSARTVAAELLGELPADLLVEHRELVRTLPAGALRSRLERRLGFADKPVETLWQQLVESSDAGLAHDLILTLAAQDAAAAPLVSAVLVRNVPAPGELTAIELAGRIHLATAVNALADRLSRKEPAVAEAAADALGRIGTAGAATILEQRCNLGSATAAFRMYAARAMARFRIPSVEATLLRLLVEEDDQAAMHALCMALADVCTTTGFARLKDVVGGGKVNADATLKKSLFALELMVKSANTAKPAPTHHAPTLPSSAPAQPPASAPSPMVTSFRPFGLEEDEPDAFAGGSDELPLMEIPDDVPPAPAPAPAPATASQVTQLRRDAAQVGRNDLCPCGSGQKYKKCCGK